MSMCIRLRQSLRNKEEELLYLLNFFIVTSMFYNSILYAVVNSYVWAFFLGNISSIFLNDFSMELWSVLNYNMLNWNQYASDKFY